MRTIFDKLCDSHAKYYSTAGHLADDEVIVLFISRIIFKRCISNKHKWFGIKIYKLCDSKGYTYKDRKCASDTVTATHATVTGPTSRIINVAHEL
jgi:hypothetical protein